MVYAKKYFKQVLKNYHYYFDQNSFQRKNSLIKQIELHQKGY